MQFRVAGFAYAQHHLVTALFLSQLKLIENGAFTWTLKIIFLVF